MPFSFNIDDNKFQLYHYLQSNGTWYKALSIADLNNNLFVLKNFLVYPNSDNIYLRIAHMSNDSVFLKTNWNAPNGKVILANITMPNQLSELIPEYDINLRTVKKLGRNKIACVYLHEGQNIALIFNNQGEFLKKIDFPKGKRLKHLNESHDDAKHTAFSISSFFHPPLWYQISMEDLTFKPVESLSVPYDASKLETRYVSFESKDGTTIPMYITCHKDTKLNGKNPVLMYGYGGYGVTVEPFFEETIGLLLLHGGILAVPNIRGGGAKGDEWAKEGRRLKKQNAIDDFIGAAEYLIDKKYTSSKKLVIKGGSHGGMLVGAAFTQRPTLFKAAVAEAGVYDMLRFNKYTVASMNTNIDEFGLPDNYEDYVNLKSYSPLHNVEPQVKYPNLLLITGDGDDRVPPHHTYKFLTRLQNYADPTSLYHMYVTPGSGHSGSNISKDIVDKLLFECYFIFDQLDIFQ